MTSARTLIRHPHSLFRLALAAQATLIAVVTPAPVNAQSAETLYNPSLYQDMQWRNIGPSRGGRAGAVAGVPSDRLTYYMGTAGGGVWKTSDAGESWSNVTDGFLGTLT